MNKIDIAGGPVGASRMILGCMRMPALSVQEAAGMIETAVGLGINFFDHATCYGGGEAEKRFGDAIRLTDLKREDLIIHQRPRPPPPARTKDPACAKEERRGIPF